MLGFIGIPMDSEVKSYEIAYLINPDIPEDEVFGQAGKITGFVQDAHGLVGRIEEPKKRHLAYPIKKSKAAYFGWTTFTAAPEKTAEIEKQLKSEKNILRALIVEEVKRPVYEFRPRLPRPVRRVPSPRLEAVKPFVPAAPKEEDQAKIEALDKQLEEILGT